MHFAFAAAIIFALSVVGYRKIRLALARRQRLAAPGLALDRPLQVADYQEVESFLERTRCPACGRGHLYKLGEGTVTGPAGVLTCVRTECLRCETRVGLYLDVSAVPN